MSDEKDRFGDKLHNLEKAREDQWAREQDKALLDKLRQRHQEDLHCPKCKTALTTKMEGAHAVFACPSGHGAWLDQEAMRGLSKS